MRHTGQQEPEDSGQPGPTTVVGGNDSSAPSGHAALVTRRLRRATVGYARSTPVSSVYLFVLVVTTWVLQSSTTSAANSLLLAQSTNLSHLARDPVRVLIGSAFWLTSSGQIVFAAAMLILLVGPFERRLGGRKTVVVLALGHVGATLVTAVGLWVGLRTGIVDPRVVDARDVGPSYAFFAVTACLGFLVDRRLRLPYFAALAGYATWNLVVSTSFTDLGHLFAICFGLGCYPIVRRARPRLPPVGARISAVLPRHSDTRRSLLS
jgi:hypothetical protein